VQTFNNFVEIRDGFSVDFDFSPDRPTISNNRVSFTGTSDVPGEFFWSFGDGDSDFGQTTSHTFQDTGIFNVTLLVRDNTGCLDTITKPIFVSPIVELQFPNAFTPDGDDKNDLFFGKGNTDLIANYELLIFDRWGTIVFQTDLMMYHDLER